MKAHSLLVLIGLSAATLAGANEPANPVSLSLADTAAPVTVQPPSLPELDSVEFEAEINRQLETLLEQRLRERQAMELDKVPAPRLLEVSAR